jgi:hypothetical protein
MKLCEEHYKRYGALSKQKSKVNAAIRNLGKITRTKEEKCSQLQKQFDKLEIMLKPFSQAYIQRGLTGLPRDILNAIVDSTRGPGPGLDTVDIVHTYGVCKSLQASLHDLREQKVNEAIAKKKQQLMEVEEAKDLEERRRVEEARAAEAGVEVYSIMMCSQDNDGTMKYLIRFWDQQNGRPYSLGDSQWHPADECPADLLQLFNVNGRTETVNPDFLQ